jgi:hypothetical protein
MIGMGAKSITIVRAVTADFFFAFKANVLGFVIENTQFDNYFGRAVTEGHANPYQDCVHPVLFPKPSSSTKRKGKPLV